MLSFRHGGDVFGGSMEPSMEYKGMSKLSELITSWNSLPLYIRHAVISSVNTTGMNTH